MLVLLALNVLCQAKNFGAWEGFLRTVGEQRWGGMGTAPIGNTGLRILSVLHLPDAEEQVKNGLYCTFSFLGNRIALQNLLICRKHCTSMISFRQNCRSPLLSWEGKLKVHQLSFSRAVYVLVSLGYLDCLARSLFGRQNS